MTATSTQSLQALIAPDQLMNYKVLRPMFACVDGGWLSHTEIAEGAEFEYGADSLEFHDTLQRLKDYGLIEARLLSHKRWLDPHVPQHFTYYEYRVRPEQYAQIRAQVEEATSLMAKINELLTQPG